MRVAHECVTHGLRRLGGDGSGRETSARGTPAGAFRLGARAYVAELCEQLYQIPQTGVSWNGTTVTRSRAHVMWISWRDLGERCACSSLREGLRHKGVCCGALRAIVPQTEVSWNGTTVTRSRAHVMWISRRDLGERCACSSLRKGLRRKGVCHGAL